jgi:hypothetical protein
LVKSCQKVVKKFVKIRLEWDDYTWRNRKLDLILTKLLHTFLL